MLIKAKKQLIPQKLQDYSYESLKKQISLYPLSSSLSKCNPKQQQYLQVNYIKNFVYKVDPLKHLRVPPVKQQQSYRDYLMQVKNDQQRILQVNQQIKDKIFKFLGKNNGRGQSYKHNKKNSQLIHNRANRSTLQMYDPVEHLERKRQQKQKITKRKAQRQEPLLFLNQIDSVKYIQPSQSKFLTPLPQLNNTNYDSNLKTRRPQNQQLEFAKSIQQLLQKSIKYQNDEKSKSKKLKSYKSRLQLDKDNQRKVKTQRNKIMKMIQQKNKLPNKSHQPQYSSLNEIPAIKKYEIDFVSYSRTKTKQSLDKIIYEKLIKKPEKDLQKFQQFILNQVKFQNLQNKHKIQRFFIKMREQFRRVQKYGKQGSQFDWRSKSMELKQIKDDKLLMIKLSNIFEDNKMELNMSQRSKQIKRKRKLRERAGSLVNKSLILRQSSNKEIHQNQIEEQKQYSNLYETESEAFLQQIIQ